MVHTITYEDLQAYYHSSAYLMALTLKARCQAFSLRLLFYAWRVHRHTRLLIPALSDFVESHPEERSRVAEILAYFHFSLLEVIKIYDDCPLPNLVLRRTQSYWLKTSRLIENCLESIPLSLQEKEREDQLDLKDAQEALAEIRREGAIPWEKIKCDLGL